MLEILIICTSFSVLFCIAFITGLHYGTKVKNNESVELPNPVKIVSNYVEDKQVKENIQREQEIEEINLQNIDKYDGTSIGQKDFPDR